MNKIQTNTSLSGWTSCSFTLGPLIVSIVEWNPMNPAPKEKCWSNNNKKLHLLPQSINELINIVVIRHRFWLIRAFPRYIPDTWFFFLSQTQLQPLTSPSGSVLQVGLAVMTVAINACGPLWGFTKPRGTGCRSFTARFVLLTVCRASSHNCTLI